MRHLPLVTLAAAVMATSAPAFAQTLDEVIVSGHGRNAPKPETLSEPVSYADLDLRVARDRTELRHRISDTARSICDRLGEPAPTPINIGHSCQERAISGSLSQVRVAIASAGSRRAYAANAAGSYAAPVSARVGTPHAGPIPDTAANRARYGGPISHAGKKTRPAGN